MTIKEKLVPTTIVTTITVPKGEACVRDLERVGVMARDTTFEVESAGPPKRRWQIEATDLELRMIAALLAMYPASEAAERFNQPNLARVLLREETSLKVYSEIKLALTGGKGGKLRDIVDEAAPKSAPVPTPAPTPVYKVVFKVEDRVRFLQHTLGSSESRGPKLGSIGRVVEKDSMNILVRFDNTTWWCEPEALENLDYCRDCAGPCKFRLSVSPTARTLQRLRK